jgi:hypothetical protein
MRAPGALPVARLVWTSSRSVTGSTACIGATYARVRMKTGRNSNTVAVTMRDREQFRGRSAFDASVTIMVARLADSKSAAVVAKKHIACGRRLLLSRAKRKPCRCARGRRRRGLVPMQWAPRAARRLLLSPDQSCRGGRPDSCSPTERER